METSKLWFYAIVIKATVIALVIGAVGETSVIGGILIAATSATITGLFVVLAAYITTRRTRETVNREIKPLKEAAGVEPKSEPEGNGA